MGEHVELRVASQVRNLFMKALSADQVQTLSEANLSLLICGHSITNRFRHPEPTLPMYKILGTDQKQYGPVTADQLRQWIKEGRANAQTLVQSEGSTEWKPLSAFPELADALAATTVGAPAALYSPETSAVAERVSGPANGLMAVAIIGFVLQAAGLVMNLAGVGFATAGRHADAMPAMFKGAAVSRRPSWAWPSVG